MKKIINFNIHKKGVNIMGRYLLESPYTKEECLKELDEVMKVGRNVLNKFYWGCSKGDHTGYAIVDTEDELKALNIIPGFIRNKAKAIEVQQFTPEQIKSFY